MGRFLDRETIMTKREWLQKNYPTKERLSRFSTVSDMEVDPIYMADELPAAGEIGEPGEYPFTRGPYGTMYRTRLWSMRQFAGFGGPEDTNRRFKYLLEHGQTGLSTAFDMPTLMGYDADHPRSLGEVGREGVSVSTLDDMQRLFDGIPLDRVTTSMTINCSASATRSSPSWDAIPAPACRRGRTRERGPGPGGRPPGSPPAGRYGQP